MSNIYVYSTTPNWKITSDIRNTRLKDLEKEEIILFKEISWEICRYIFYILFKIFEVKYLLDYTVYQCEIFF
jgi:hypothetical protein